MFSYLHDAGRSAFFVATNHRKTFDEAITRPGRFDLLLFIGPPSWSEKLKRLKHIVTTSPFGRRLTKELKPVDVEGLIKTLHNSIEKWVGEADLGKDLDLFTYGEMKSFFEEQLKETGATDSMADAIKKLDEAKFKSAVKTWVSRFIILHEPSKEEQNPNYSNYLVDKTASRLQ